jgi:amino acid transporter
VEEISMGRELRRKQAKKEGKSLKVEIQNENNQIKKLLIITVSLVLCIGLLYILSALFITKEFDWFDNDSSEQKPLVANTILASEIFKQKEE